VLGAPPLAADEEGFVHFVAADDTGAATSSDWSLGRPRWSWRLDRPNVSVALLDHLDQQPKWVRSPSSKRLERASLEASLVLLEGPQAEFAARPVQATTDADLEVAYDFDEFSRLPASWGLASFSGRVFSGQNGLQPGENPFYEESALRTAHSLRPSRFAIDCRPQF
jgi:hypothetical protein